MKDMAWSQDKWDGFLFLNLNIAHLLSILCLLSDVFQWFYTVFFKLSWCCFQRNILRAQCHSCIQSSIVRRKLIEYWNNIPSAVQFHVLLEKLACLPISMSSNSQSIMAAHSDYRVRLINQHEILSGHGGSVWIWLMLRLNNGCLQGTLQSLCAVMIDCEFNDISWNWQASPLWYLSLACIRFQTQIPW